MLLKRIHQSIRFGVYLRKIKLQNQIRITLRRGMLPDVVFSKQRIKLIARIHIIIQFQHGKEQRLTEPARTDEEKETGRFLNLLNKTGFIHVIIIIARE